MEVTILYQQVSPTAMVIYVWMGMVTRFPSPSLIVEVF
jgi:hypothetical protein